MIHLRMSRFVAGTASAVASLTATSSPSMLKHIQATILSPAPTVTLNALQPVELLHEYPTFFCLQLRIYSLNNDNGENYLSKNIQTRLSQQHGAVLSYQAASSIYL